MLLILLLLGMVNGMVEDQYEEDSYGGKDWENQHGGRNQYGQSFLGEINQ